MITWVLPLTTPLPWSPVHARTCCKTLREGGDKKKTKNKKNWKAWERARERDWGGGWGKAKIRGCGKGKKCHATAAVLGRFSKKKQDRKWEKRGNCGCNWSTRRATQTGEGVRYMPLRQRETCCHWLIPHFLLPLSWYLTEQLHDPPREAWWTVASQTRRHKDQDVEREWRGAPFLT